MSEHLHSEVGVWSFVTSLYQQKLSVYFTCPNQISFGVLHSQIKSKSPQIVLHIEEGKKEERKGEKKAGGNFCVYASNTISPHMHGKGSSGEDVVKTVWSTTGVILEDILCGNGRSVLKYSWWSTEKHHIFPLCRYFYAEESFLFQLSTFFMVPSSFAFPKISPDIFSCGQRRKWIGNYTVNIALQPKVWEGVKAKLLSETNR